MKVYDIVREELRAAGILEVGDDTIEYLIWEKTGYPHFWPDSTKTPEENFRNQIRHWCQGATAKKFKRNQRRRIRGRDKVPHRRP